MTTMELDRSIVESVNKANKKLGEFFYLLANEPSVGLYHVQEHIRKTIPKNTEVKREIRKKYQNIEAMTYDVNFSIQTVKSLHDLTTFSTIKQTMESCIELLNSSTNKGQQGRKTAALTPTRPSVISAITTTTREPATPTPTPTPTPVATATATATTPTVTAISISTPTPIPTPTTIATTAAAGTSTGTGTGTPPSTSLEPPKADSPRHAVSADNENKGEPSTEAQGERNTSEVGAIEATNDIADKGDNNDASGNSGDLAAAYDSLVEDGGVAHKRGKKTKKPKAAKNLERNFDLTPKQF